MHAHNHTEGGVTHVHAAMVYDTYLSMEAYGRIYLRPKWVLNASLPFVVNAQRDAFANTDVLQGLGDVPLILQRQVFNRPRRDSLGLGHRLFAGLGVKLPTGRFDLDRNDDPHLQTGTGSWDGLVVGSYMALWRRWALAADANLRISTPNKAGYRFGERVNATATIYRSVPLGKATLMPALGSYLELGGRDRSHGEVQSASGGLAAFGTAGLEAYLGHYAVVTTAQLPVYQALHGYQPQNKLRLMASVGYSF
jgi:Putative MetA-pathway of phenol degradation